MSPLVILVPLMAMLFLRRIYVRHYLATHAELFPQGGRSIFLNPGAYFGPTRPSDRGRPRASQFFLAVFVAPYALVLAAIVGACAAAAVSPT